MPGTSSTTCSSTSSPTCSGRRTTASSGGSLAAFEVERARGYLEGMAAAAGLGAWQDDEPVDLLGLDVGPVDVVSEPTTLFQRPARCDGQPTPSPDLIDVALRAGRPPATTARRATRR